MSNYSLLTIQEMIDSAFGEEKQNVVNFKLLHTIFFILASQLRLLQRKVEVEIDPYMARVPSTLSVTEVKIKANVPKKRKKPKASGGGGGSSGSSGGGGGGRKGKGGVGESAKGIGGGRLREQTRDRNELAGEDIAEKSETDKSSEITSTDKTTSKSTTDKTTSSSIFKTSTSLSSKTEKSSIDKSSEMKSTIKDSTEATTESLKKKFSSQDYHQLLEIIEQQREQELRVVNQRADSREEAKKLPTPMASLDEMVERVPTDTGVEAKTDKRDQPLSVVTQDQYDRLAKQVRELQEKFGTVGRAEFPENIELMQELRRGASLTDAMAALQLSARVEAAEKALEQMMTLVTDVAKQKGVDISTLLEKDGADVETEVLFGGPGSSEMGQKSSRKKSQKQLRGIRKSTVVTPYEKVEIGPPTTSGEAIQEIDARYEDIPPSGDSDILTPAFKPNLVTHQELDDAMALLHDTLLKAVTINIGKSSSSADSALNIATRLERKLNDALNLNTRMDDLETLVTEYATQINSLDTGLSAYMTDYQEQLTQMQHDLEVGLESMSEAIANTGGDTAAAAELNTNITNLQMEFDTANIKQKNLKDQQGLLFIDLEGLWKQIEILRETKSDREEVADALRDKAGLGALNGLVSQQQFDAVRGDFEKRIGAAYDKFNNQEIIWQKAIDDLLRELNEKADWIQVASLRDDVNANLEKLRKNIKSIMDIVGEPNAAAVSKKLFHDTACLSCASPANMELEKPDLIPALPAFPKSGDQPATDSETNKPKEDGDHLLCYPGRPIPHPKDPRSHICQRYCGGSHTIITGAVSRAPVGMIITPLQRRITTGIGTDGKVYLTDAPDQQIKPCLPCNVPKPVPPQPSEADEAPTVDMESASLNFLMQTGSLAIPVDSISVTPPPPLDDD
ncbi:Glutamine-rich protein 2 [Danaus plexippus plexippus]|uniref:Glutamine-rich protein 2 n=1 Tax=Danaus plexippus plexippus TaxID=278856 RepID=A0A212FKZ3_DANPL|nr:Glutamine-rich protein 2 [Danaus plexippus plexippus]